MKIKYSICISAYNDTAGLKVLLGSIKQNLKDKNIRFEVLIYNDGGVSVERGDIGCLRNSNVTVYNGKENNGLYFSRNFLKSKAKGNYVYFIDSDDLFIGDFGSIDKLIEDTNSSELYFFSFEKCVKSTKRSHIYKYDSVTEGYKNSDSKEVLEDISNGFGLHVWQILFRRDIISSVDFQRVKRGSDMIFIMDVLMNQPLIYISQKSIYRYMQSYAPSKYDSAISDTYRILFRKLDEHFGTNELSRKENTFLLSMIYLHWFVYVVPNSILANNTLSYSQTMRLLRNHFKDNWMSIDSVWWTRFSFKYKVLYLLETFESKVLVYVVLRFVRLFGRNLRLWIGSLS